MYRTGCYGECSRGNWMRGRTVMMQRGLEGLSGAGGDVQM